MGSQPAGESIGPTVDLGASSEGSALTVHPGDDIVFDVAWTGGAVGGANVGFGGPSYFQVPAPPGSGGGSSGHVLAGAKVDTDVCNHLGSVCHNIECYPQVALPDGSRVSKQVAMKLVLNCTGGIDCNGDGGLDAADTKGDVPHDAAPCTVTACASGSAACTCALTKCLDPGTSCHSGCNSTATACRAGCSAGGCGCDAARVDCHRNCCGTCMNSFCPSGSCSLDGCPSVWP